MAEAEDVLPANSITNKSRRAVLAGAIGAAATGATPSAAVAAPLLSLNDEGKILLELVPRYWAAMGAEAEAEGTVEHGRLAAEAQELSSRIDEMTLAIWARPAKSLSDLLTLAIIEWAWASHTDDGRLAALAEGPKLGNFAEYASDALLAALLSAAGMEHLVAVRVAVR